MRGLYLVPRRNALRAALLSAFTIGLMVTMSGLSYRLVQNTEDRSESLVDRTLQIVEGVTVADRDLFDANNALKEVIWSSDPVESRSTINRYLGLRDQAIAKLNAARADCGGLWDDLDLWETHEEARDQWVRHVDSLITRLDPEWGGDQKSQQIASLDAVFKPVDESLNKLMAEIYAPLIAGTMESIHGKASGTLRILGAGLLFGALISIGASVLVIGAIRRTERHGDRAAAERAAEQTEKEFERRLLYGLEMAESEPDALGVTSGALTEAVPGLSGEVLLADSSMAHLEMVLSVSPDDVGRRCQVPTPNACPAVRRGAHLRFEDSRRFDVCPYLKDRPGGACSAMCTPVTIMGKTVGVMHTVGEVDKGLNTTELERVRVGVKCLGDRLGLIRAFADSQRQATTDPLTGLPNRRSVEDTVRALRLRKQAYTVAYGDIDHFKLLNDKHGHETGDRALRMFAEVVRKSLRPDDTVGRWGGEEFVFIIPQLGAEHAAAVVERVRQNLAERLRDSSVPCFTASFGVAEVEIGEPFDERLNAADEALLEAKQSGRDRVVIAARGCGPDESEPSPPRDADPSDQSPFDPRVPPAAAA